VGTLESLRLSCRADTLRCVRCFGGRRRRPARQCRRIRLTRHLPSTRLPYPGGGRRLRHPAGRTPGRLRQSREGLDRARHFEWNTQYLLAIGGSRTTDASASIPRRRVADAETKMITVAVAATAGGDQLCAALHPRSLDHVRGRGSLERALGVTVSASSGSPVVGADTSCSGRCSRFIRQSGRRVEGPVLLERDPEHGVAARRRDDRRVGDRYRWLDQPDRRTKSVTLSVAATPQGIRASIHSSRWIRRSASARVLPRSRTRRSACPAPGRWCGASSATLNAVVRDRFANPVPGWRVLFNSSGTRNVFSPMTACTTANQAGVPPHSAR